MGSSSIKNTECYSVDVIVPSIVVNNSATSNNMEKTRSSKNRLSKQDEFEEVEDEPDCSEIVSTKSENRDSNHWDRACNRAENEDCQEKSDGNHDKDGSLDDEGQERDSGQVVAEKDSDKSEPVITPTLQRQRSHPKVKLLQRSHALCDDTSPPPDLESANTLCITSSSTTQSKGSSNKHHKLGKQGSSQGSLDGSSPCLSRDSSIEQYTDSTGIDLQQFIVDTLHRNQKDRILLFKLEQDLIGFVKDNKRSYLKFPQMSSYQRMLVHRVAAFFGMEHNVDQAGTSVIVNKTKNTRVPDMKFREQVKDELVPEEPKRSILKRDSSSFEEGKDSSSSQEGPVDSPVRSHESTHNSSRRSSQEDLRWVVEPRPWSSTDSDSSNRPAKPVITKTSASTESDVSLGGAGSGDRSFGSGNGDRSLGSGSGERSAGSGSIGSRDSRGLERRGTGSSTNSRHVSSRGSLSKAESADSSTSSHRENTSTLHPRSRLANVPKASSFGGISVLVRGDSITSTRSATPRLTKAESFSSSSTSRSSNRRLSPSRAKSLDNSSSSNSNLVASSSPSATSPGTSPAPLPVSAAPPNSVSVVSPVSMAVTPQIAQVSPTAASVAIAPVISASNFISSQSQPVLPNNVAQNSSQQLWTPSAVPCDNIQNISYSQNQTYYWVMPETVPAGSILVNGSTGQPVLNSDGSMYRIPQAILAAGMPAVGLVGQQQQQQNMVSSTAQPLMGGHGQQQAQPPPPPLQAMQAQQQQSQPQQQQQLPPVVLYTSLVPQSQPQHPEQRHFSMDSNTNPGELASQLSSLSFSSHTLAPESGSSGDGSQMMQTSQMNSQGFVMPASMRPAGLVATTQGNVSQQMPSMYYVPSHTPVPSGQQQQPMRMTYPVQQYVTAGNHQQQVMGPTLISSNQQQQHPSQIHSHPSVESQSHPAAQTQIPGQYVQNYPMMGYAQVPNQGAGDGFSINPYYQQVPSHSMSAGLGNSGNNVPAYSGYPVPTSMGIGIGCNNGASGNSSAAGMTSLVTSQSPFITGNMTMSSNVPPSMYGAPPPAQTPTAVTHCGPPFSHSTGGTLYRPQTPPNQQSTLQPPNQLTLNSAFMSGYGMIPHQPPGHLGGTGQMQQQATTPSPQAVAPSYTPYVQQQMAFPMFRPSGMQLMTVRSSTPPPTPSVSASPHHPHGLLQTQYGPGPLLTKSYSLPADHRFGKTPAELYMSDTSSISGIGNVPSQDGKNMAASMMPTLTNNPAGIRPPATPLYGRNLPLVQMFGFGCPGDLRLLGPPLQQQLPSSLRNSLVLPQQRPMHRFQVSQQGVGVSSATGRPPKVRKQRSKSNANKVENTSILTPQASVEMPENSWGHILEVQSLPDGLKRTEAERYLEELTNYGGKLHFVTSDEGAATPQQDLSGGDCVVTGAKWQVLAVFDSETEAQSVLVNIKTSKFQVRFLANKPPAKLQSSFPC